MFFLENNRRYCRTYSNLEASVQKELSFYQQKAKEWAEVQTLCLIPLPAEDFHNKIFYFLLVASLFHLGSFLLFVFCICRSVSFLGDLLGSVI